MNKFISALLFVAVVASSTSAFTTQSSSLTTSRAQTSPIITGPSFDITSSSSTALNLKVDPNSIKGNKNNSGNSKMAAYGGSIVFAALLPIAFLIWSAIGK